ncbi:pyridoxal phosphate phosphatase [Fukomys damarensis]|uniref:pyridoxal phosphate phosphatase n=1 Tax=Fukomys damarensis TaxID=885580 RepID=UPI0005401AEB|nr:pyridoxal phosphate phosphatase [Fukomys damarensis]
MPFRAVAIPGPFSKLTNRGPLSLWGWQVESRSAFGLLTSCPAHHGVGLEKPRGTVPCGRVGPAFLRPRCAGTGSLAAAVETASGRQALVVGKPSPYMFECITEHFRVDPARMLMVGDRLETDILFGHRCGMTTVLTLTGVSRLEEAQAYLAAGQHDLVPHYYVESVADLMGALED